MERAVCIVNAFHTVFTGKDREPENRISDGNNAGPFLCIIIDSDRFQGCFGKSRSCLFHFV